MKNNKLFDFVGKSLLVVFLFSTHANLFYWLKPLFIDEKIVEFSFTDFNEQTIQAMVFGLLFGIMTLYILERRKQSKLFKYFVITIALLDGVVVHLLYNDLYKDWFKVAFASSHYTIYTVFIIIIYGFSNDEKRVKIDENNENEYQKLFNEGNNPKAISKILGVSITTVYRNLENYKS